MRPDDPTPTPLGPDEWRRLYPRLRRFAAVVADADMEPDDLVQDALASVLASPADPRHPEAYLRAAVVRHATDRRRRAARWRDRLPRLAGPTSTSDRYPSDDELLARMAPLDRAVLHLSIVEGRPHDEIAGLLGLTATAVRQRAHRARKRARIVVEDERTNLREVLS